MFNKRHHPTSPAAQAPWAKPVYQVLSTNTKEGKRADLSFINLTKFNLIQIYQKVFGIDYINLQEADLRQTNLIEANLQDVSELMHNN